MKNAGKVFEEQFKKPVPEYCMIHRLKDTAQSYNNSLETKFAWNNPCDFFIFNSLTRFFYCLELKSTKYKSMNFQIDENDNSKKMIKYHQRKSLREFAKFNGVYAGFLFNFRNEDNGTERTYFQKISDFERMIASIPKKSFDEMDLLLHHAIKVNGTKKRINYIWDIDGLLKKVEVQI